MYFFPSGEKSAGEMLTSSAELFTKIEELKLEVVEYVEAKYDDLVPDLSSVEKLNRNFAALIKEIDDIALKTQSEVSPSAILIL